jgi:hypothetical protein
MPANMPQIGLAKRHLSNHYQDTTIALFERTGVGTEGSGLCLKWRGGVIDENLYELIARHGGR